MFVRHTFANQWNGLLGYYWSEIAREEVQKLYDQRDNMIIEDDGAVCWKSSGNYLPDDCMEKFEYAPYEFRKQISREATKVKREEQDKKFIEEYREQMKYHVYTEDELSEMRNAFGSGKVYDVLADKVIDL